MLPAAVTCSYAFMLPVATPPNAIVFSAAKMNPIHMVILYRSVMTLIVQFDWWNAQIKAGFLMNIVCVVIICFMMEFYGNALFDIYTFPDWANSTTIPTASPCILVIKTGKRWETATTSAVWPPDTETKCPVSQVDRPVGFSIITLQKFKWNFFINFGQGSPRHWRVVPMPGS